ncbi:YbaB/EbfC family nucleoid-associated protein [Streptosporangium sp. NPDC048047]|uniref:YbaB/EbfC family nucleoid-associated protein n=1 Tax=Streptosporangium sp. NPDC048047 TaxID=3155748 RepID=UPI003430A88C
MNDGFPQAIKEMAHEYNRQAARLRQAYGELAELTATAQSDDQMVTVTVGPRGQIQDIELDPRVYRKLSPSELSHSIMEQIGAAVAQTAERTRELMEPFLPAGLPYEQIFGEEASLESFLPQPVDLRQFEEGANG